MPTPTTPRKPTRAERIRLEHPSPRCPCKQCEQDWNDGRWDYLD